MGLEIKKLLDLVVQRDKGERRMSYQEEYRAVERNTWWTLPRVVLLLLAVVIISYGLGFLATGGDLAIYRFWAPKQADAQRVVFENTQGYVQGKAEYISRLRYEYEMAKPDEKPKIKTLILDEASTIDNSKLPADIQIFLHTLQGSL